MYRDHPSHPEHSHSRPEHSHLHSHSQSQSGCSSPDESCTYTPTSASSCSPALGYSRHNLGNGMDTGSPNAVPDDRWPYIRGSTSNGANNVSSEPYMCGRLTNPAVAHSLVVLTHQLMQTVELVRQLPEHTNYKNGGAHGCTVPKSIGALRELMQASGVKTSMDGEVVRVVKRVERVIEPLKSVDASGAVTVTAAPNMGETKE
ncbi:hypothetical protein EIP86_005300 [Pleurotus ostreatoroseus]|nr:hypothetical protein EIP86_005300 [Pleurotus ostreatoroseus]